MLVEGEQAVEAGEDVIYRYDSIKKSSEDKWEYRGIQLKNKLTVLLVSDSKTDKSAAALNVAVGHLSDPDNIPGMAHFCEHMLLLGSKKYPQEYMYEKFLWENDGNSNASTFTDKTVYFFDVIPEQFAPALDIFAQFFISPLFTISATDRELIAVNSEYERHVYDDWRRIYQLDKFTSDPNHPFHKFGTGNRETLETTPKKIGVDLREKLLEFHSKWYSANIMTLVILGKESLDELEKMVVEKFSEIENKDIVKPSWPQHPYSEDYQGLQMSVVPVKNVQNLCLDFPIPDARIHYKNGPLNYINQLIGHGGPGSLLSLLKVKGWCYSLQSYSQYCGRGFATYSISVDLTENGINHIDDIVELVFQYIHLLNKEGIQQWIFDEQANILEAEFKFQDKKEPLDFVKNHVNNIQDYPMEEIMSYKLTEWNPELIQEFLSMLTPERMRMKIVGKVFESVCGQSEKWYGTKYHLEKISIEKLDRWNKCGLNEGLHLPAVNSFLADNFDLFESDSESKEYPTIVHNTPLMRVWFKQDDEYSMPKMNTFFEFVSPIVNFDPLNYNLNTLFISLLKDSLNELTYAAELAGINYLIRNTITGFSIRIAGYNAKQHVLLNCIMDKIASLQVNPERFAILKENYIKELKNFDAEQPHELGFFYLNMMLSDISWSKKECLNVQDAMTIDNLHNFIKNLLTKIHIECFVHGNATKNKAIELAFIVEQNMPKNVIPLLSQQLTLTREIQLEMGSHYKLEIDHTVHSSSCVLLYLQCGLRSPSSDALIELLLQILSEICFNILKTKEQCGYIIYRGSHCINNVQGIQILVQSEKHPCYVESRIEVFLRYLDDYINQLTDQEYNNHRNVLIEQKLKHPKVMLDRSIKFWSEISFQQYQFDRENMEVKVLRSVTKNQLYNFYKDILLMSSPSRGKLRVHIISSANSDAGNPGINDGIKKSDFNSELFPSPRR